MSCGSRDADERAQVLDGIARALPSASGRVLVSLRSHLENADRPHAGRLVVTRRGRPHLVPETRAPLPREAAVRLATLVDDEIARRLQPPGTFVVDPAILPVALPISGKATADGHAVLPRGTTSRAAAATDVVRFFVHWRQAAYDTDFDLSVLFLDDEFRTVGQVSWTNLQCRGAVHSGDLVEAPDGATEFIDVDLAAITARHVVAEVNVYSGEGFDEVAESLFGYMTFERAGSSQGSPRSTREPSARVPSSAGPGGSRSRWHSPGATTGRGGRRGSTCC